VGQFSVGANTELYLRIESGAKGGRERFVPLDTRKRLGANEHARQVVSTRDGRVGSPFGNLKQAMDHFDSVMKKFEITKKQLGVTSHGLRHGTLIDHYHKLTGKAPPVHGAPKPPRDIDTAARQEIAALAGHSRTQAAAAYIGSRRALARRRKREASDAGPTD